LGEASKFATSTVELMMGSGSVGGGRRLPANAGRHKLAGGLDHHSRWNWPGRRNRRKDPCRAENEVRRDVPASRRVARGLAWATEIGGRTPCPAVDPPRPLEDPPRRRRRDAEDVERAAAGALVGEVRALPPERFARFGGRTPCPAVRRTLSVAKNASMRRQ
jgi:hypothetical protein